ncbi:MAG: aldolase, partial [Actinomycetes bacterium]
AQTSVLVRGLDCGALDAGDVRAAGSPDREQLEQLVGRSPRRRRAAAPGSGGAQRPGSDGQ